MAGQADGDRPDHAVSGMRRTPGHDHHGLAGMRIPDAGRHRDQLVRDVPLDPLEPPGEPAASVSIVPWLILRTFCAAALYISDKALRINQRSKVIQPSVSVPAATIAARRARGGTA